VTHHPNQKTWLKEPATTPRSFVPRPNEHSALPAEYTKAQAIQIGAKALAAMGLASTTLAAWRLIADTTELSAWHSRAKTPINFRKVRDLACELGVSDRQWRRIEVQLEEHGLIARATTDNGFRGKAGGGALTFGLSLEPAIRNFAQLLDLSKRPEQEEQARKLCLGKIRATRKRLKALASFDPLSDTDAARWATIEEMSRPARLGYAPLGALEPYLFELSALEEYLRERQTPRLELAEACTVTASKSGAIVDVKRQEAPCPTAPKINKTATKMSDAADTDVRCQYNLEYKQKRLNICHEGNAEENLQDGPSQGKMYDTNVLRPQKYTKKTRSASVAPDAKAGGCSLSIGMPSASNSGEIVQRLPGNTLFDLASITDIHKNQQLLADIKLEKQGTACQGLDPQHIWARFRRYNLKRDKQILPVAALRAFIRGWIVDAPQSYRSAQSSIQGGKGAPHRNTHTNKTYGAGRARPEAAAIAGQNTSQHSREEVLDYYADVVNKGGYIPQTMISPAMMRELRETGRV